MRYEAVIGLEVHAQLLTTSKIFCGCPTAFGSPPNAQTCPICIGMPGVLPVLNERALEFAVRTGLAMNCRISPYSRFARKNYFYPDLPKGYQISQYELPICEHGWVELAVEGHHKRVGITRIHMEEDAGKNIHEGGSPHSLVDLNRTGVPLMEIVSEPDIRSAAEAGEYMRKLRTILRYIGVCDGNMEQGSLRCDANISVRPEGQQEFGTRAELKNLNSFRFVERAIEYEIKRQTKVLKDGGQVVQETRLWDSERGVTVSMRSKEEAHDYRYFPDPDLVPITEEEDWINRIREAMPELPDAKLKRFTADYGLPEQAAYILTEERATAEWFEEAVKAGAEPKAAANWFIGDITKILKKRDISIEESLFKPDMLAEIGSLIESGTASGTMIKSEVLDEIFESGKRPKEIIKEKGLVQITDEDAIQKAVDEVVSKHPGEAGRYRGGEEKLLGFFVGQVMKLTKGKANPKAVNELLRKRLG